MTDTKKPLSISAYKKFMDCPKLYDFHYNERLRPTVKSSNLVIGVAWDDAINCMLEELIDPIEAFKAALSDLSNVRWDKLDYDGEILTQEDRLELLDEVKILGYDGEDLDALAGYLLSKPLGELSDNQKEALNKLCRMSSIRKAELMLDKYREVVLPMIKEVECVQKEIQIGDRILGIADYVALVEGHGRVLLDNKTSRSPYKDDAVQTDPQLALYAAALGCDKAGFVVVNKKIKKNRIRVCQRCKYDRSHPSAKSCQNELYGTRCGGKLVDTIYPEAQIQVIIDDIPEHNKAIVIEAMTKVNECIDNGIYPRNLGTCQFMYGKPCPYINKCWKNNNEGLTKESE